MNRTALWISAAATLLGIVLLRVYLDRFEQEASGGPVTRVLVPTHDLAEGAALRRDQLAERALPQAYLESRHIAARDLERVLGARLGVAVRAGETLLWTDLSSLRERGRQLSSLIPEGMRALALELRSGTFDGLLVPGDRVDVLLTKRGAAATDLEARPSNLAQSVLVLAVGDDLGGPGARRVGSARSVSLGVSLEQAAALADADQRGDLHLLLRNPDDLEVTAANAAQDTTLLLPTASREPE